MQAALSPSLFIVAIVVFTLVMLGLATLARRGADADTFFAAGRKVSTLNTAFATAIGWMWADCFFSTTQIGHDYGIYGLMWFVLSTTLSFVIFAFLAVQVRHDAPQAVTLPEFVALKSNDAKSTHVVMTAATVLYQLFTLGLNATITGFLLNAAFGFDYLLSASSIVLLVLTYSLINGLKTSTYTGVLQYFVVLCLMTTLVAVLYFGVDLQRIYDTALLGVNNAVPSFFDQKMVLALAIPLAIILLTQPFVDQMIFQRLIALKKPERIIRSFVLTGVLCGIGIFTFGSVGFLGLDLSQQGLISVPDPQLVIVSTIGHYLSATGLLVFIIAFFAIVFSTIDAGYCAISALVGIDIYKKYLNKRATDADMVRIGRVSMIGAAVVGILLSLAKLKILWMLFIVGVIGGALVAPIIFAMVYKKLSAKHVTVSIILSLIAALPASIYGNIVGDPVLVSAASVGSIVLGAIVCAMGGVTKRTKKA